VTCHKKILQPYLKFPDFSLTLPGLQNSLTIPGFPGLWEPCCSLVSVLCRSRGSLFQHVGPHTRKLRQPNHVLACFRKQRQLSTTGLQRALTIEFQLRQANKQVLCVFFRSVKLTAAVCSTTNTELQQP